MKKCLLATALLFALPATPAFAAATAMATLGPISITLIDLDPLDGVEASITFSTLSTHHLPNYAFATTIDHGVHHGTNDASGYSSTYATGSAAFDPFSTSAAIANASASASLTGPGTAAGSRLHATGSVAGNSSGSFTGYRTTFQASLVAPYYYDNTFSVSNNTRVLFSAALSLSAAVTSTWGSASVDPWEFASANAGLSVSGSGAGGAGTQLSTDARGVSVESIDVDDPGCTLSVVCHRYGGNSATDSANLVVTFENTSGGDLTGLFETSVNVYGHTYAPAVPEPGITALLLAGLGAVGFVARRRRG